MARSGTQRRCFSSALAAALIFCTAAHAAERARFLFSLAGAPVGAVMLEVDDAAGTYRYTSTQTFTRGSEVSNQTRSESFRLHEGSARVDEGGRVLESLWLWRGPWRTGCVDAESELDHRVARLCVTAVKSDRLEGTIGEDPFRGRVSNNRLLSLELPQSRSRFDRIAEDVRVPPPADLFGKGWPIGGAKQGRLVAVNRNGSPVKPPATPKLNAWPDEEAARRLAAKVHRELQPTDQICVDFARRFVADAKAQGREAVIVHGLVVDPNEPNTDRALPHAWVRIRTQHADLDLDPTLMIPVTPKTHLPLAIAGDGAAGRAWLELLAGTWKIHRAR